MIYVMKVLHNFHVPLPESVYRELREIAEHLHRPATQVGREAIESWLKQARQTLLAEAIRTYAEQAAGTEADLDPALEEASVEYLSTEKGQEA
jgi:predicted transcriptional regulator